MIRSEWLTGEDPAAMLSAAAALFSPHKCRLWACAIARCDWDGLVVVPGCPPILTDIQDAVEAAEGFCDGLLDAADLYRVGVAAAGAMDVERCQPQSQRSVEQWFYRQCGGCVPGAVDVLAEAVRPGDSQATMSGVLTRTDAILMAIVEREVGRQQLMAGLLREVLADPFRFVTFAPLLAYVRGRRIGRSHPR